MNSPAMIYEAKDCAICHRRCDCLLARRAYMVADETRYHVWWQCQGCGENALGASRWIGRAEVESYRVTRDNLPIRDRAPRFPLLGITQPFLLPRGER